MFVITGILFVLYAALRPYSVETGVAGADAFASPLWVVAHVCAMFGFVALVVAVRKADEFAAVVLGLGAALVLPYYGAETFALNALGSEAQSTGNYSLIDLADPIRFGPTQIVMFGAGLILVAAGAVLFARRVGSWQSALFAAGFVLFLPQFFAPPWLRIAHGLLILVGAVALALQPGRTRQEISTTTGA
ncbi:hypothetical protein [Rhodococcoides yunnanense]|uniref:hypothetical protein n=1 Tax=Rhodococcoides yunnanense TaxID=278209 RepID=UPI0009327814|nr:hypothetical protein [Rhodococcus yunnanensis]